MENISNKTKSHYFKATEKIKNKPTMDYRIRRMRKRLQEEFDAVWVRYEKGEVTFDVWEKALNKWLQAESI